MAKQRGATSSGGGTGARGRDEPGRSAEEAGGVGSDEEVQVQEAEEAVLRAKEELERARRWYEEIRGEAADRIRRVRQSSLDDLARTGLRFIRKNPGTSVVFAAVIGFFLGRLFRR